MHRRNVEVQLQHTRKFAHIGVGGQHEARPLYPQENIRYPFYMRISGPRDRYGKARKISPTGI